MYIYLQSIHYAIKPKIQTITLTYLTAESNEFIYALSYANANTSTLNALDDAASITEELNGLPTIQNIGRAEVYMNRSEEEDNQIIKLTVVFISNVNSLTDVTVIGWNNHSLEATQNISDNLPSSLNITMGSKTTSSLMLDVSTEELTDALYSLYSVECQITNEGSPYFKDSFDIIVQNTYNQGSLDTSVEPYCGRTSLRNPRHVFRSSRTVDELTGDVKDPVTITSFGFIYVSTHYT